MRPIAPKFPESPQIREFAVAEEQEEYKTIYAAQVQYDSGNVDMFCRWTFTPEERARIAAGEDVYLSFPQCVAPHTLQLRPEWAR